MKVKLITNAILESKDNILPDVPNGDLIDRVIMKNKQNYMFFQKLINLKCKKPYWKAPNVFAIYERGGRLLKNYIKVETFKKLVDEKHAYVLIAGEYPDRLEKYLLTKRFVSKDIYKAYVESRYYFVNSETAKKMGDNMPLARAICDQYTFMSYLEKFRKINYRIFYYNPIFKCYVKLRSLENMHFITYSSLDLLKCNVGSEEKLSYLRDLYFTSNPNGYGMDERLFDNELSLQNIKHLSKTLTLEGEKSFEEEYYRIRTQIRAKKIQLV